MAEGAKTDTVQSYTKIISDAISTQRPNTSLNHASSPYHTCILSDTDACVAFSRYPTKDSSCEDRSRLLVILRWCMMSVRNVIDEYLSSPMLLAIIPLLVGVLLGICIGWWLFSTAGDGVTEDPKDGDEQIYTADMDEVEQATMDGEENTDASDDGISENMQRRKKIPLSLRINQRQRVGGRSRLDDDGRSMIAMLRPFLFLRSTISHLLQLLHVSNIKDKSLFLRHQTAPKPSTLTPPIIDADIDNDTSSSSTLRDNRTREYLQGPLHTLRESNIPLSSIPHHIAVIMDGNRRYGRAKYSSMTRGHWDGSKTLVDFCKWCMAEGVQVLTVYAFSTENWGRSEGEVNALMRIFRKYSEEIRVEALNRGIKVVVLSTEDDKFPDDVMAGLTRMEQDTKHCTEFILNICISYGSRGEIVNACRSLASDAIEGKIDVASIDEAVVESKLLTYPCSDPDIIIRTSGEFRLSNFLLWQVAYSEMFFLDKMWPELTKGDLIEVLRAYAGQRDRRFGK